MISSVDNLNPNSMVLGFLDSITKKSLIYEIIKCENGPLAKLINAQSVGNHDINNLAIINKIFTLETAPRFQQGTTPAVKLGFECSIFPSPPGSFCFNLSESSNLFLLLIHELYTVINAIYQNTLGNVIKNVVSICFLIQKSILFYHNERKIIRLLSKDYNISSFKRGGYLASAAALNHARKSALSLLAWKIFSLATAVLSVLAIIAFILGCIFAFNAGGIFANVFLMSPAAWILGGGGLAFLLLGILSIPQTHCSHNCRQSAVDSIHRSLLCLQISERIRVSDQDPDNLASIVARNCLSPYSDLLDPEVFPLFTPSEESMRRRNTEEMQHIQRTRLREILTSTPTSASHDESSMPPPPLIPPPYIEFPPTYEEVMEEDRIRNQSNRN
ncbi:inclusion membrane protein GarD [Chlamydia sp. 04-14]|uniref:inclusion membrane protein GarD n=1 Tax=Chlamydia TaxID=810 RepID=UPI002FC9BD04